MKNNFFKKWLALSAFFAFLCFSPHGLLRAQSSANYAFSTNATGSLIDMSTGTTQLIAPGLDAAASGLAPIGFSFPFMGNSFTQFSVNEDAVMQLGGTAVGTNVYTIAAGTPALPRLAAFNADLRTGTTTGKVHYKVIGAAPNRQLVVEFLNMQLFYTSTGTAGTSTFQMILSETSGKIDYIYGTMSATDVATGNRAASIGFYTGGTTNSFASVLFATHTNSTVAAYAANPNITVVGPITNLTSAADGSRRVYTYTPPAIPVAPTSLTFTSVGSTSMTLNWVDNSTTEYSYTISRSLDGITYTNVATLAANTTSYIASGLAPSTLYYWNVTASSETGTSTPVLSGSQSTTAPTLAAGIKTVGAGGDYQNLTTAFADINAQGLAGNVELQLITGYPAAPESYPIQSCNNIATGAFTVKVYPTVSGLSITSANATGTLNLNGATNLTFDGRVNQTGANDLIIANTNAGTSYAILFNNDARYNTITNAIVRSVNTSGSSGTIVFGTTTGANGNDNNTIANCDITDGATTPLNAIYSVGTTTTTAQFNDNNIITGNNISNFFSAGSSTVGVFVGGGNSTWTISNNKLFQTATRTYTTGNTHNGIQVSNTSGNGFVITGNTIGYASSTATGTYTMAGTVTTRFIGINISAGTTTVSSVQGNTITAINLSTSSGAATGNGIVAGINITNGNVNVGNVTPNIIGSGTGTGSIVATTSTAGGLVVGINSSSAGTVTINGNTIGSINGLGSTATTPASVTGIQVSAGTPTINSNMIGSTATANSINAVTVATGATTQLVRGIDVTSGVTLATSIQSNTVSNLNQSGTTTGGSIRGINFGGSSLATISLNTVNNLSGANGSSIGVIGILNGGAATAGAIVNKNTVYNLASTNTGAIQTGVIGIGYSGPTAGSVTGNRVYDLRNASTMAVVTTPPTAAGILLQGAITSVNVSNNMVSLGDAQTTNTQFIGILNNITSTGVLNIYHNSVSVSGTAASGALPSYGFQRGNNSTTAVTSPIDFRNNIISNTRTGGTGKHYAIANQSATASTTGWGLNASNYNVLNAAPATIGLWGATDQTFNAWRTAAASDANSSSAVTVTFVDVPTANLHLNMGATPTPIESGGAVIASVTTDFDNDARPGPAGSTNGGATAPDLGADEFDGVPAIPVITLNSVTPPAAAQCTAAPRVVSVNVNPSVGTTVSATIGYAVNGVAQTPISMTNTSGTTWQGTIPAPTPVNATISWAVTAINSMGINGNYAGTAYSDEPLFGISSSATASLTTVCSGSPTTLTATLTKPVVTIGTATTLTGATTQPTAFCNRWSSYKMQTIYTAAELTAAGLTPGTISTMTFNITTLGDAATNNNFVVKIGNTALSVLTDFVSSAGYATVFSTPVYTHAIGANTIVFTTPYNWDGTSNIVVEVTHDGANVTNNAQTYYTATAANMVAWSTNGGATGTVSLNRLNVVFNLNGAPAIQSISWSDGVGTVGTTNPLTVNPTANTTYTATIVSSGCTVTPAPTTTVAVNPLPTAPTATNSAQCGVQVPTASVTSTSGLPTPSFNWYAASSGGSALQSSTSTTYTTTVATTTTFYVSELNTVTGCESVRVPVTVNVSTPDQVSLTASVPSICIGGSVTLTAANLNPTPFQFYTYSTVSATTGSGAETPMAGASISVTPTAAGTYTYTLTATDGGCAASATATVAVNSLPMVASATATPATVCSGNTINLSANIATSNATSATLGTGTTTEFGGGVYRNGYGTGDFRHQLLYTAAEMNAAGFAAGTITSLAFNVTGAGAGSANNYTIKLANVPTAGPLTATFATGTFTTVYSATTYTAIAGLNTHTFSTPFVWDGTSNILVDICYNISTLGSSATLAATTPAVVSNTNLLGSAGACSATAGGATYANRPLIAFTMNYASNYNWLWSPGTGLNTAVASTSITNTSGSPVNQVFTVTVTNPATGCANTGSTSAVTINSAAPAPVANNSTQCGTLTPTASVTGTGTPGNTYSWYLVPTGGTAIAGQTGSSLSGYPVSATTTFYVSEENGTCSSARTPVTVTVTTPPAITVSGTATICNGSSTSLSVSSPNDPNYTYTWSGGLGTGATVSAAPTVGTTYTVTATDASGGANNGCVTLATYAITVNPSPTAVTASSSAATICNGNTVNLTSSANSNTSAPGTLTEGFETFPPTSWTMINAGSGNAWSTSTLAAHSGTSGMAYVYNEDFAGNAWAITPQLNMVAGQTYTISFWYKVRGGSFPEKLKVTVGNAATVAAQTSTLWNNNGGTSLTNTAWAQGTTSYTPGVSGNYYVGFNCYSDADEFELHVDDVSIQYTAPGAAPTYAWTSSPAGFTSAVQNPTNVAPAVSTTYTVTATNSLGCSNTASVAVTVNQPTSSSVTVTACDTYTWTQNATTYTTSGTHTATIPNAAGCDSVITLNLTIKNSTAATATVSACDTYTWPINSTTYTTSGTHTATIMNAAGCDSVITLNLTIKHSTSATVNQLACQTYTWPINGTTYITSGTHTATIPNAAGCDSVITLNLTINQPNTGTDTQTACGSYTWNGTTYNTSGTYTQILENAAGCDSTVTLTLIINQPTAGAPIMETECTSFTWAQNGMTYNTSGLYTDTIPNAAGCDSVITLDLTIIQPTTSSVSATECTAYTWAQNGMTYNASGAYTDTIPNGAGCDSIITLNLTITQPTSSSITVTACGSYTWAQTGLIYLISGSFHDTIQNGAGCDSVITLNLTVFPDPIASVTNNGNGTMTASAGTSFIWLNCVTNLPVAGATSQTFAPTANGSYSVVVTSAGGCVDTSDCVPMTNLGIKDNTISTISVHPNPTHDVVIVTMDAASATVEVMDVQGKLIQVTEIKSGDQIDLGAYERGVYTLRIKTEFGTSLERIVKN